MLLLVFAFGGLTQRCRAQDHCFDATVPKQIVRDFGHYATAIVKSPAKLGHLNGRDIAYLIAFSGATAALLATDTRISNSIDSEHEDRRESNYASNLMIGAALSTSTINTSWDAMNTIVSGGTMPSANGSRWASHWDR